MKVKQPVTQCLRTYE